MEKGDKDRWEKTSHFGEEGGEYLTRLDDFISGKGCHFHWEAYWANFPYRILGGGLSTGEHKYKEFLLDYFPMRDIPKKVQPFY